ncbi:MAG TPA: NAD-dependent epimerase/dehydratase family protein [Candidatus Limnocylindrales bacterium]|nr:NAD-dependent epimerase/dehydratase family protein [Candidatus Limnocylindrales bacterium]
MRILVTGSSGLIGSEAVLWCDGQGHTVHGIDNNMRRDFFGEKGDTRWMLARLRENTKRFTHVDADIRDRSRMMDLWREIRPELVIHCASQPSHDLAATRPLDDFDVNAVGTINLLEATRLCAPEAVFVLMSTNKVYGDSPNTLPLVETETRYDYADPADYDGIRETQSIDQNLHSVFGASKVAADVMTQEYGRYFGLRTGTFRGGCLTGPSHSGVELHGFLNYLAKVAVAGEHYRIFGYKGKQVRDQIHSYDVMQAIWAFAENPRPGEVYNLGGGRDNAASVLECIAKIEAMLGRRMDTSYHDEARKGDHICYISDLSKFRRDYPSWQLTRSFDRILEELVPAVYDAAKVS